MPKPVMVRMEAWTRRLVLGSLLTLATDAGAQPTAWSSQSYFNIIGFRYSLQVLDVGVGRHVASFDAPPGVTLGSGALTPDGQYYLLATSVGLARFTTSPPAFERLLGPSVPATGVSIAPTGTIAHVTGDFGHAVIDWRTGDVRSVRCCAQPGIAFSPDGTRRIETQVTRGQAAETSVMVIDTANEAVQWERRFAGASGPLAVSNHHLAFAFSGETVVLDLLAGAERGRIPQALSGIGWRGDTLVAFRSIVTPAFQYRERLSTYSLPALDETVVMDRSYTPGRFEPIALYLSAEGRYAYWLHFVSLLGISVSSTSYEVVDLDEARTVGRGSFGYQRQTAMALESAAQCVFSVPDNLTAPARGAVLEVPAAPAPNCRPWMAPGAINPGPHIGAATVREQVDANTFDQPHLVSRAIGGTSVQIAQAADVPAAPTLHGAVDGDRIRLSWEPGIGAGITSFEILGAVLGGAPSPVAAVSPSQREWTSPPLGTGSYVVQVAARNFVGAGPASNAVPLSIGVRTLPESPTGFAATVIDDQVTLVWDPPANGPAPSGYVVEASPASASTFAPVIRTTDTRLYAIRVPPGPWAVRVRAVTDGGGGPPSPAVTLAPTACTTAPASPSEPWPLQTYPSFTLRWSAPANGSVEEYVIEVGSVTGATDLGRVVVRGDQTTLTVPQVSVNSVGFARIRARNACGQGSPSPEVMVVRP